MDAGQVMMAAAPSPSVAPVTPSAALATPSAAVAATATSGCECFGSLLGQVLAQLPKEGSTAQDVGVEQPVVEPVEPAPLAALIEKLAGDSQELPVTELAAVMSSDEPQDVQQAAADQAAAQQVLASYLQAAMLPVPQQQAQPMVDQAVPLTNGLHQPAETSAITAVQKDQSLVAQRPDLGFVETQRPEVLPDSAQAPNRDTLSEAVQVTSQRGQPMPSMQPQKAVPVVATTSEPTAAQPMPMADKSLQPEAAKQPAEVSMLTGSERQLSEVTAETVSVQKPVNAVAAPVKFAQQPDVVVATGDPAAAGDEGGQYASGKHSDESVGRQPLSMKPLLAAAAEPLNQEQQVAGAVPGRQAEQHVAGLHVQRQNAVQETTAAAESAVPVAGEQVAKQVAERLVSHSLKQGADQISLKLSPEHLGNLQMNIRMDEQRLRIEVVAEQRGVRDALLQQVDELKETLARQNIKMDSFDVTTSSNGSLNQQAGDWRQTASERKPLQYQQYGQTRSVASLVGDAGSAVRYFAPQYQSTLDVRF